MSNPLPKRDDLASEVPGSLEAPLKPGYEALTVPLEPAELDDTRSILSAATTLLPGEYYIPDKDFDGKSTDQASLDTVLINMSGMGDPRPVLTLLQRGANAKARDRGGETALHKAATKGYSQIVTLLLQYGADPNVQGNWYGGPLQLSVKGGHVQVAKDLIAAGADVNDTSGLYGPALQLALNANNTELVQILLEAGADVKLVTLSQAQRQLQSMAINGLVKLPAEARKSAKSWSIWKLSW